jgi:cell division GTPase FtsZ
MNDFFHVVGLGQCGMRISSEFQRAGFYTAVMNSDEVDARGYQIEEDRILVLKKTGTGKSLKIGRQIVEENRGKFESFLRRHANKKGLTLFIAGGGGGTGGSFVAPAAGYLKEQGYKVGVIYTLPPKMLGMVPAENALRTLKELTKIEMDLFILVDNEVLLEEVGKETSWWGKINRLILSTFYSSVEVLRSDKTAQTGLGSIDRGELIRTISYGKGLTDIRRCYLTMTDCDLPEQDLSELLFKPQLIEGYDYKTTLCYLVSIDVPQNGNFTAVSKKIFDVVKRKVGNGISILGMFQDPLLKDSVKVTVVNSGLRLPKVLQSRIKNLKRDEQAFLDKQGKSDVTTQIFSDLDLGVSVTDDDFSM